MMSASDFANHMKTEPRVGAARVVLAIIVFLATGSLVFIAMTELGIALLAALADFRHSAALAFALVIYAPTLVVVFILSVIVALWASRQAFSRPKRWPLRYLLPLAVLSIAAVTVGGIGVSSVLTPKNDVPPLADGLHGPWVKMSKSFAQRLGTRFPVGTAELALVDELRIQRFHVDSVRHEAVFDGDGFPCRNAWYVSWRADNGRLVAVTGSTLMPPICL